MRSIAKYYSFSLFGICRQHSPIDKGTVSDVRVAHVLSSHSQEITDEGLEFVRVFKINFDSRAQYFKLYSPFFHFKVGNPFFEGRHRDVIDLFCILSQDPDSCFLGFAISGVIKKTN